MATTTYTDATFSVAVIGDRTDSAGADVDDYTAEEARFPLEILTAGYLKPAAAFVVQPQETAAMSVLIGSGAAKADFYVIEGVVGGQGNYLVRLDATNLAVSVPAADASQDRTDEVYLVVRDNTYDASSRGLPQVGYRRGDLGGAAPGPDPSWEASALLASVSVPALATEVDGGNITDERVPAGFLESLASTDVIPESLFNAKGDLVAASGADTAVRVGVGSNGQVLTADTAQAAGVKWATPAANATGGQAQSSGTTSTSTGSYVDVADASVTVTVGNTGIAVVQISGELPAPEPNNTTFIDFTMSGANTKSASDTNGMRLSTNTANSNTTHSKTLVLTGLTAGSTTFTMQIRSAFPTHTAGVARAQIAVVAF